MGYCSYNNKAQPIPTSRSHPGERDTGVRRHLQNMRSRIQYDRSMYVLWEQQGRVMSMVDKSK